MKKLIVRMTRFCLNKLVGQQNIEKAILFTSRLMQIDLLMLTYQSMGILKYKDNFVSGEHFVISQILEQYLQKEETSILFDVGANIGDYSKELRKEFPNSYIYAFEPNVNTFALMKINLESYNIKCFNIGFSAENKKEKIYTYADDKVSGHASVYKNVLVDLHRATDVLEIELELTTIDYFCHVNKIEFIHFLKIDTEGHELAVLNGAKKMINENKIGIIQFEFNEMNIVSRVFLKDFYEILREYSIYRLDSNKLIPLIEYNSTNEIFKFQNFLAINRAKLKEIINK